MAPFFIYRKGDIIVTKNIKFVSADNRVKDIISNIQNLGCSHGISTVFSDYITIASCAVSNRVDKLHFEERENLYMSAMKKYSKEEVSKFAELHKKVVDALEQSLYEKDLLS